MISLETKTAFLQHIHLFHDLSLENVGVIASLLNEETFAADEPVFHQGNEADRFYIIYRGAVKVVQVVDKEERKLAELVAGDYFGEQEVMNRHRLAASVVATERSIMFSIPADQLRMLLKKFPRLRAALDVSSESRTLARKLRFKWLRPDEVIYFLARKHEVQLAKALSAPILAVAVPIFLTVYFFLTRSFLTIFAAGASFVLVVLWGVWNYIDWGNDYYILTNMRVIWLERVIGIYDSRQEAPLSTVLSVGVETDQAGRLMDYGNVIIRTFTGRIPFNHVPHPYEAAHLIEEQWSRSKRNATQTEKEAMRNELRRKMGLTVETKPLEPRETESLQATPTFYRRGILQIIGSNWFNLRLEDSGTITYRKHWFVLIRQTWEPTLLIFLLAGGMVARTITLFQSQTEALITFSPHFHIDTIFIMLPVLMLPLIGWWIYQYVDWRNDIFQVTPDQIIDIDKKPFGTEERRAAPLENILSTEAERLGLTGYLLNYGTVYIMVGGVHLDFRDVWDPRAVQADVDRRREARIARKREADAAAERERMTDWLVAYYENEPNLRREQEEQRPKEE